MSDTASPRYGPRYEEALGYAARLHATQMRKADRGTEATIPYVAHLLEVSSLVWLGGGTEDQAIAGLLHDAIEDQPQHTSAQEIARLFGAEVARLVEACSDGAPGVARDGSTWLGRKGGYLAALYDPGHSDAMLVTTADKISNARAILDDLQLAGASHDAREALWSRFNAPRQAIAWYYAEVLTAAQAWDTTNALVLRLEPLVARIADSAGGTDVQAAFGLSDADLAVRLAPLAAARAEAVL